VAAAVTVLFTISSSHAKTGQLTMWTSDPSVVTGSSCGYADPTATADGSAWLAPYVNKNLFCAANSAIFDNGAGCGTCYKISYSGTGGTDPGRKGSAIIQIVDSGSAKEFDCELTVFQKITGATTGIFPVKYKEVPCKATPVTITILDGDNAFYVKVLVAGGTTGVKALSIKVGTVTTKMSVSSGATWAASLSGATNVPVQFKVTFTDGTKTTVKKCFKSGWPATSGAQCSA